jgi:hypothetical protein
MLIQTKYTNLKFEENTALPSWKSSSFSSDGKAYRFEDSGDIWEGSFFNGLDGKIKVLLKYGHSFDNEIRFDREYPGRVLPGLTVGGIESTELSWPDTENYYDVYAFHASSAKKVMADVSESSINLSTSGIFENSSLYPVLDAMVTKNGSELDKIIFNQDPRTRITLQGKPLDSGEWITGELTENQSTMIYTYDMEASPYQSVLFEVDDSSPYTVDGRISMYDEDGNLLNSSEQFYSSADHQRTITKDDTNGKVYILFKRDSIYSSNDYGTYALRVIEATGSIDIGIQ